MRVGVLGDIAFHQVSGQLRTQRFRKDVDVRVGDHSGRGRERREVIHAVRLREVSVEDVDAGLGYQLFDNAGANGDSRLQVFLGGRVGHSVTGLCRGLTGVGLEEVVVGFFVFQHGRVISRFKCRKSFRAGFQQFSGLLQRDRRVDRLVGKQTAQKVCHKSCSFRFRVRCCSCLSERKDVLQQGRMRPVSKT